MRIDEEKGVMGEGEGGRTPPSEGARAAGRGRGREGGPPGWSTVIGPSGGCRGSRRGS